MDNQLTHRQRRLIPFLLLCSSTEEACRRAGINKTTVYRWLKDETFRQELNLQRNDLIEAALDSLKANVSKAASTLVGLLDSSKEVIQVRAAEDILEFAQRSLELEKLSDRVTAMERKVEEYEVDQRQTRSA